MAIIVSGPTPASKPAPLSWPAPSSCIPALVSLLSEVNSSDPASQLSGVQGVRKLLSIAVNPPIQDVIDSGVIPRLVHLLSSSDQPSLQFECAWALTNVASGTSVQTSVVLTSGAVPIFVRLLGSRTSPDDLKENCVWALGNIAGDGPSNRDAVLQHGALAPLLTVIDEYANPCPISLLRQCVWCLSNLTKGKAGSRVSLQHVSACLPSLARVLEQHTADVSVVADALWCFSYLTEGENARIEAVLSTGVMPRLAALLLHPSESVHVPALRAVGNVVTGDDVQTSAAISAGALQGLHALLSSGKVTVRKEACWALSNVAASQKHEHIQVLIDSGAVKPLVCMLRDDTREVKKEVLFVFGNALAGGSDDQVKYLVSEGCLTPICNAVSILRDDKPMSQAVLQALDGLINSLKVGERAACKDLVGERAVVERIDETDVLLDTIARLAMAMCGEIQAKAKLLKDHFLSFFLSYLRSSVALSPVPLVFGEELGPVEESHPSYKLCQIVKEVRSADVAVAVK